MQTFTNIVFVLSPTLWNCLPFNTINSQTVYLFKRHYKLFHIGIAAVISGTAILLLCVIV